MGVLERLPMQDLAEDTIYPENIIPFPKPRLVLPLDERFARYNGVFIPLGGDKRLFIAREVDILTLKEGEPDEGVLGQWLLGPAGEVKRLGNLEVSHPAVKSIEDPRKRILSDGSVELALTFMRHDKVPSAGLMRAVPTPEGLQVMRTFAFPDDYGKDFTHFIGDTYLFRREGNTHVLDVVTAEGGSRPHLETHKTLKFEPNEDSEEKIGTRGEPYVLPDGTILLPMHWIKKPDKYIYSLGDALISADLERTQLAPKPRRRREDYYDLAGPEIELHPNIRKALYSDDTDFPHFGGGVYEQALVNAGDWVSIEEFTPLSSILAPFGRSFQMPATRTA